MPRYVLLWHEMPSGSDRSSHWDFMLERDGVLWTWAIEVLPAAWCGQLGQPRENSSDEVAALRLDDHRLAYLDFEGAMSGNRGSVTRVATGEFEWARDRGEQLEATLSGDLNSRVALTPDCEAASAISDAHKHSWRLQAAKIAS